FVTGLPDMVLTEPVTVEVYAMCRAYAPEDKNRQIWHVGTRLELKQNHQRWIWTANNNQGKYDVLWSREPIKVGQRTHLAGVSTGKELRFFVDGKHAATTALTIDLDTQSRPSHLGGAPNWYGDNYEPFDGTVDELRVSKTARYEADFPPPDRFKADADTILLYHIDEGDGNVLHDASGHGYDGT